MERQGCKSEAHRAPCVGIVILHWGPVEVTERCLQSLGRVSYPAKRVILVDNACSLEPAVAEAAAPLEVEILRPGRNLGFAEGCTWGIHAALGSGMDYILLLNNDVVVEPGFLDRLVEVARRSPGVGLLCPQIVFLDDPEAVWYAGGEFSLWGRIPRHTRWRRAVAADESPTEVDFATGCAMLVDPKVVRTVGSFDPRFFAYCEDLDFSLRVKRAGFKILMVPSSVVHHAAVYGDTRSSDRVYYSTRNLLEVMRKHATWYQWLTFIPSFLVSWVGFFLLLACIRRQPSLIRAMTSGVRDSLARKLGQRQF